MLSVKKCVKLFTEIEGHLNVNEMRCTNFKYKE